jgi:competence protein ComEC
MSSVVVRILERIAPPGRPGDAPRLPAPGWRLRLGEAVRRLADGADADLAAGAGPPLLAAVFAIGIALYFSLPREPWGPALAAVTAIAVATTWTARRRGSRALAGMVVCALLCGAVAGSIATTRADAPRLDRERTVAVTGRVSDLDATAKGGVRLGVEVATATAAGLAAAAIPTRVTATLPAGRPAPQIGEGVTFKARLKPPQGPVLPSGYDFARRAWFEGRGASGYVFGSARPVDLGPPQLVDRIVRPIGTLRHTIAERVRASLPGATGTIAAALMVGEQRAIPESAAEPLRASGLTHIVSISGLHMSLVAGGVMVALRLLFVAIPGFPLHRSAKKWAAIAAFGAATAYLLLSGMQVAALRSHLMVSLALLAVLVDRPAITMHTVAVAAVAILAIDPEQAMEPSFRMSFLAVIALVASWDLWQLRVAARPPPTRDAGPVAHGLTALWRHAEGLAFSSLVAGLATAPVIAGVFYRGAPYSILANMIVLPVVGLLVMPAAIVAALVMPFGLEDLPLWAMGLGIDYMVAVGRWVSSLPGGAGAIGRPHELAMPLGIVAVLWLSLWRSRLRLFGLVPALLAAGLVGLGPRSDVMIGRDGSPVAARGDDGRLHVLAGRDDHFDVAIWLAADGDPRAPGDPSLAEGWRCDRLGCVFRRSGGGDTSPLEVAVVRDPRGFAEECRNADVVVTPLAAPPGCAAFTEVFDRPRRATTGATALTVTEWTTAPAATMDTAPAPRRPAAAAARAPDDADGAAAISAPEPHSPPATASDRRDPSHPVGSRTAPAPSTERSSVSRPETPTSRHPRAAPPDPTVDEALDPPPAIASSNSTAPPAPGGRSPEAGMLAPSTPSAVPPTPGGTVDGVSGTGGGSLGSGFDVSGTGGAFGSASSLDAKAHPARVRFRIETAHPAGGRPWTPRDSLAAALAAEVTADPAAAIGPGDDPPDPSNAIDQAEPTDIPDPLRR